jgi:succinate-semialdehyde dehydrogenase/glutarate-semialdehyde dehydrogenase
MRLRSINPATEEVLKSFEPHSREQIEQALDQSAEAFRAWRRTGFAERARLMNGAANYLRANKSRLGAVITSEMGKPITEAEAEVEKCAWNCEYYAGNAEGFLRDESRVSSASESCIAAKRFIVVGEAYEEFRGHFVEAVRALKVGDPMDRATRIGPQRSP